MGELREATVELSRARVRLTEAGDGPPLLLLHGFPMTRLLWRAALPLLAQAGHRAIALDLAGYGESLAAEGTGVDMASQADLLHELCDKLQLARVSIAAHDVGTAAAQIFAVRWPERVRALALIDGVCGDEWAMDALASILAWPDADAARLFAVLVRTVRGSGKLDAAAVKEALAPYQGDECGRRLLRAARALDPRQTADLLPQLARLGLPLCVLWARDDKFLPADRVGQRLADALGVPLELLDGGHFLPLERPAETAASLARFFAQAPA